ncbi:MAG: metallophosphoesterase [Victivallales bacterium]|nr:metallophosphoesterase [Victivallales bacterium]
MNRKIIYSTLFFVIPFIAFSQLRIGIIGDQTGTVDIDYAYNIMQKGCDKLKDYNPQLVLHVGDMVESSFPDKKIKENFKKAAGYLNSIKLKGKTVPWYTAAGDHDVNPEYKQGSSDRDKEKLFLKLLSKEYSRRKPQQKIENLYYSFDYKGCHFICLYSEEILCTDPRWGNIFMNKISDEQFNWLKKDLQSSNMADGTIVLIHQPMWYNWTNWCRVHDLLKQYGVTAVVAGHFHYNQKETIGGIQYIVVGSTGGKIKNASENAGGIYHVTLMTVDNAGMIDLKLIPIGSDCSELQFTRRKNMDRIQAIDSMIGIFPWNKYNGKAVKANPIDLPISVMGSSDGNSWHNVYPEVNPATGVISSNLSTVTLDSSPKTVESSGGVRYKFYEEGQQYWNQVLYNSKLGNYSYNSKVKEL